MLAQPSNQTDIFSKFYSPADTFCSPKTAEQVLGYTTGSMYRLITLDKFLTDQSTKTLRFQMFHMPNYTEASTCACDKQFLTNPEEEEEEKAWYLP